MITAQVLVTTSDLLALFPKKWKELSYMEEPRRELQRTDSDGSSNGDCLDAGGAAGGAAQERGVSARGSELWFG
jgi:hypothetical protein